MTDYDELSYLRKLAREQQEKLKAYQSFQSSICSIMQDLSDKNTGRETVLISFFSANNILNQNLK